MINARAISVFNLEAAEANSKKADVLIPQCGAAARSVYRPSVYRLLVITFQAAQPLLLCSDLEAKAAVACIVPANTLESNSIFLPPPPRLRLLTEGCIDTDDPCTLCFRINLCGVNGQKWKSKNSGTWERLLCRVGDKQRVCSRVWQMARCVNLDVGIKHAELGDAVQHSVWNSNCRERLSIAYGGHCMSATKIGHAFGPSKTSLDVWRCNLQSKGGIGTDGREENGKESGDAWGRTRLAVGSRVGLRASFSLPVVQSLPSERYDVVASSFGGELWLGQDSAPELSNIRVTMMEESQGFSWPW